MGIMSQNVTDLEKEFTKLINPKTMIPRIILEELNGEGIHLNDKDNKKIQKILELDGLLTLNLPDDITTITRFETIEEVNAYIKSVIDNSLNVYKDFLENSLPEKADDITSKGADILFNSLEKNKEGMLKSNLSNHTVVCDQISFLWGDSLDSLETIIKIVTESIDELSRIEDQNDFKLNTLVPLYIRMIHTSNEILCLLKNGFADGALARWRTLHELSVTSRLLCQADEYTCEKYLAYQVIDEFYLFKATIDFSSSSLTEDEKKFCIDKEKEIEYFKEKYGENFKNGKQWNWASTLLKKNNCTFRDIETFVSMSHCRPAYKKACEITHAGASGNHNRLGSFSNELIENSSVWGINSAGINTSLTLTDTFVGILSEYPSLQNIIHIKIISKYNDQVIENFDKAMDFINKNIHD